MIVPMKKIAVIVRAQAAAETVEALRRLGLLHVEHQQPPQGDDIVVIRDRLGLVNQAVEILSEARAALNFGENLSARDDGAQDRDVVCRRIVDAWKRLDQLQEYAKGLQSGIDEWRPWGNFEPGSIHRLAEQGIIIKLYKIPLKEFRDFPEGVIVEKIAAQGAMVLCAFIGQSPFEWRFRELELPASGLEHMQGRLAEDRRVIDALRKELEDLYCRRESLAAYRDALRKDLEFLEAIAGMNQQGALAYITGYAPSESQAQFLEAAHTAGWGILISAPGQDDNPPVLLRNPRWISLINPVYKLMEVAPGYRELDVSPLFLLFLVLFFGMIIGDAGYGAVYCALTFLAQRKYGGKTKDKKAFYLFYLFSFCAVIWGLLTGTVFGQQWYLARGFHALAPALNDAKFFMAFCFLLGALQLSLAHGWQALIKLPSVTALADVGFICLLWAGFFLAKMFILGDAFPPAGQWLIWTGMALIVFFVSPGKNIFKTALAGLGVLALGLVGNFGDVVSYIRLFAVGLAGVAVADAVNMLAGGAGINGAARLLILFIGHSINIVLGPMSVLVHGIRLNVLEFSLLHGNVTWSGAAYRPLKE